MQHRAASATSSLHEFDKTPAPLGVCRPERGISWGHFPSDAANDLLDQVLPEPSGQWAHAQQQAVINRSEDRSILQAPIRSQLTFILASPQIIVSDYATLTVEILKDNAGPVAGEVYAAAVDIAWAKHVGQLA